MSKKTLTETTTKTLKFHNHIISEQDGWLEIDVSTPKHPAAIMKIDRVDWNMLKIIGIGRVVAFDDTSGNIYSKTTFAGTPKLVHRLILLANSEAVDHINHDTLDNRASNLRGCTFSQNSMNRTPGKSKSGVTGVEVVADKFVAAIGVDGKKIRLGTFDSLKDAAAARKEAEEEYFGEFAYKGEE